MWILAAAVQEVTRSNFQFAVSFGVLRRQVQEQLKRRLKTCQFDDSEPIRTNMPCMMLAAS